MISMTTSAEAAADEAIAGVSQSLDDDAKLDALIAVETVAKLHETFTTDDIPFAFPEGIDVRAAGAIMRIAVQEKLCEPTDIFRKSTEIRCHARPKRVWRSLML